uniref:Uncharacterized protein n=1 Tax=Cuerna arida TaxID=1464854 RepID=A0A1B6GFF2_9HEMI
MAKISFFLTLTLLIDVFVSALPVENDNIQRRIEQEDKEHDRLYGRHLQVDNSDLALGEVVKGKPILYRRQRSLESTGTISTTSQAGEKTVIDKSDEEKVTKNVPQENIAADETATTTMPGHLKVKERANEICQEEISKFSRNRAEDIHGPIYLVCNIYCCYLEVRKS